MHLPRHFVFSQILSLILLCALSTNALAQDEDDTPKVKIVIMTIPGGGTRTLADELKSLPSTELHPESWFDRQVKKRGFNVKKIMKNTKDLKWVMSGAKIDLILRFKRNRKKTNLYVGFVGPDTAKVSKTIKLTLNKEEGFTESQAKEIKTQVQAFLKTRYDSLKPKEPPKETTPKETTPKETTPNTDPNTNITTPLPPAKQNDHWIWLHGSGRLIKRDLSVGGRNGAVLNYQSAFYPGYQVKVEMTPARGTPLGLYVDFTHGFDSINVTDNNDQQQTLPLTQLRFEGGAGYYLDEQNFKIRLCVGGRWASYSIEQNDALPSTSQTAILVSGRFIYPLMPIVQVYGGIELMPLAFWGEGMEQFGTEASTYGMGTSLGLVIDATRDLGIQVNYGFEMYRTVFTGNGSADFEEARGFELIQGLQAGIVYRL